MFSYNPLAFYQIFSPQLPLLQPPAALCLQNGGPPTNGTYQKTVGGAAEPPTHLRPIRPPKQGAHDSRMSGVFRRGQDTI